MKYIIEWIYGSMLGHFVGILSVFAFFALMAVIAHIPRWLLKKGDGDGENDRILQDVVGKRFIWEYRYYGDKKASDLKEETKKQRKDFFDKNKVVSI